MVMLKSFQTSQNERPTLVPLSNGYTLSSGYTTASGAVVCEFDRSVTVPSGSEALMHDLTDPVNVLYATGSVTNGQIDYHAGQTHITPEKIAFVPSVKVWIFRFSVFVVYICYVLFVVYKQLQFLLVFLGSFEISSRLRGTKLQGFHYVSF